jgi:hypothetical protein
VFYRQASIAYQTQQTLRLVSALVAEARALNRRSRLVANATGLYFEEVSQVLHAAGAVPENAWNEADGTIVSPWGQPVRVWVANFISDAVMVPESIFVTIELPPREVCARLAVFDGASGDGVLGHGIVSIDMTALSGGGLAVFAPSDRWAERLGWSPPMKGIDFGGLTPAEAGEHCRTLDQKQQTAPSGYLTIGFAPDL